MAVEGRDRSLMAALVAVLLIPAVLGSSGTIFNDGDVSWHIATGQWILDHRAILDEQRMRTQHDRARRVRTGTYTVNGFGMDFGSPFGGFKMSGVGRDGGRFGFHAYSELQSIVWPG